MKLNQRIQMQTNLITKKRLHKFMLAHHMKGELMQHDKQLHGLSLIFACSCPNGFSEPGLTSVGKTKYFSKSILNRLSANHIGIGAIGSGIILVGYKWAYPNGSLTKLVKKAWLSYTLACLLNDFQLHITKKSHFNISKLDTCLGAFISTTNDRLVFIQPCEIMQSAMLQTCSHVQIGSNMLQKPKQVYNALISVQKRPMMTCLALLNNNFHQKTKIYDH